MIRDLLTGAKRFTDLMDRLGGITPKTLSQRLRELEAAGIVTADRKPGRREVWYRLTPAGAELAPVIDTLGWWGLRHAWRPRHPGEPLHGEHLLRNAIRAIDRATDDHEPARWHFRLDGADYLAESDGRQWSLTAKAPPGAGRRHDHRDHPSPDRPHLRRIRHRHRHHRRNRPSPAIPATDQHHGHRRTARLNRRRCSRADPPLPRAVGASPPTSPCGTPCSMAACCARATAPAPSRNCGHCFALYQLLSTCSRPPGPATSRRSPSRPTS